MNQRETGAKQDLAHCERMLRIFVRSSVLMRWKSMKLKEVDSHLNGSPKDGAGPSRTAVMKAR
jgi:hypothetical protein